MQSWGFSISSFTETWDDSSWESGEIQCPPSRVEPNSGGYMRMIIRNKGYMPVGCPFILEHTVSQEC